MFEIYSYNESDNLFGIRIKKDVIDLGDINYINSFRFIKYTNDDGLDIEYHHLSFDQYFDKITLSMICELLNVSFKKDRCQKISDILSKLKSIFSTKRYENIINDYIGLMCELFFIYKMQLEKINIVDEYQFNSDEYDFNFINGSIEIKHFNKENKSFKMSPYQLKNIYNKKVEIICVYLSKNSSTGINLKQLLELIQISNYSKKEIIYDKINELCDLNTDIFNEWKIDLESSELIVLNKELLPTYEIITSLMNNQLFINGTLEFKIQEKKNDLKDLIKELKNENL